MDNTPILNIQNLSTSFVVNRRQLPAVNGIDLRAYSGRMLGLVGESGCGKSVSAHSILRLLPKNAVIGKGSRIDFRLKGGEVVNIAGLRAPSGELRRIRGEEIGIVFQDPMTSLNPVYTIGAQITEKLLCQNKVSKADAQERTVQMLTRLGIPNAADRYKDYPHQFSGGMKQRVMIAMAMINDPTLLIADEPTTALDVTIQAQIMELLTEVKETLNTAVVLITHNMGIVAERSDDIAVMYMGRIVEYGTVDQVFDHPLHPYTRALLESVPILGMGRETRLKSIRGATPDIRDVPRGCAFGPRCDFYTEACEEAVPDMVDYGDGHVARCIHCGGRCHHG